MNFKHTKKLATVAVAALMGVVFAPSMSYAAAVTPTVNVNMTSSSAITVADGNDMTYGTWFVIFRNADIFSLVMTTAGVSSAVGLGAGAGDSKAVKVLAADQAGSVTVSLPAGINGIVVNMQRTAITDFSDVGLTLSTITYATATEGANQALPATTNVPVTIVTGGAPETVSFGASIDVTGTPADGVNTASFDVSFAY